MAKRRFSYYFRFFDRKSLKEMNIFEDRKKCHIRKYCDDVRLTHRYLLNPKKTVGFPKKVHHNDAKNNLMA